ncbi:MAG: WecB/TagA/CpsF family glycosyltransferase [Prevotella sp.]|nr:WecB/TagA/CpsF family glycosyltransferase [Prevotella sp.]
MKILNIDIADVTQAQLLESLTEGMLVTPNLDHLVMLQRDRRFYEAYRQAQWVICDSRVLYFCSKLLRKPVVESIAGSSFFPAFCDYHRENPGCRIFLLGGMGDASVMAQRAVNERIGREIVVDALSPSWGFDQKVGECEQIVDRIKRSKATVVVVGVGAPKQEKWIVDWKNRLPDVRIWMALGATIDFEAGLQKRAPRWWRTLGMEWLYRFLHEPRRLFRRYFVRDMAFFRYFSRQLLGRYQNPFA